MSLLKVSTSSGAYGYGRDLLFASSASVTWALTSTGDGLSGGQTTLTATALGGGGTSPVGGTGADTQVAYWTAADTIAGNAGFTTNKSATAPNIAIGGTTAGFTSATLRLLAQAGGAADARTATLDVTATSTVEAYATNGACYVKWARVASGMADAPAAATWYVRPHPTATDLNVDDGTNIVGRWSAGGAGGLALPLGGLAVGTTDSGYKVVAMGAGSTATVSGASTGRLRYNESLQYFEVSENAAAYARLLTTGTGPSGSGAATQVAYWSAATVLTGSATLIWDNTNGLFGIGTTPSYELHVKAIAGDYATIYLEPTTAGKLSWVQIHNSLNDIIIGVEGGAAGGLFVGDTSGSAAFGTLGVMFIASGNRCRMTLDSDGMVAIGPIAPTTSVANLYIKQTDGYGLNAGGYGPVFQVDDGTMTALAASTEHTGVNFNLAQTLTWATGGTVATQRSVRFQAPTVASAGATTFTRLSTVDIASPTSNTTTTTLGTVNALTIGSNLTFASATGAYYQPFAILPHTLTLTGTTAITNGVAAFDIGAITITDASSVTLGIAAAQVVAYPTLGGSASATNLFGLYVGGNPTQGAAAAGSTFAGIQLPATTVTYTGSTGITGTPGAAGVNIQQLTVSDASAMTMTNAASLYIAAAPVAASSAVITNAYSIWVDAGSSRFDGRILGAKGADVASGSTVTLGAGGNTFGITGTTTINYMTTTGWTAGSIVCLQFAGALTITNKAAGVPGGTAAFYCDTNANALVSANEIHTFFYDGTYWRERARFIR